MLAVRIRPAFLEFEFIIVQSRLTGARSNDVQRNVDGGAVQVARPPELPVGNPFPPDQPQEQSLKRILGIRSVSRDSESRLVHHFVVFEKRLLDFRGVTGIPLRLNWHRELPLFLSSPYTLTIQTASH
jgi:hypothetical protein